MRLKVIDILEYINDHDLFKFDINKYPHDFLNYQITGSDTDSRLIENGNFFVALVGEKINSHDFLDNAFNNGAIFAFVDNKFNLDNYKYCKKCIPVTNTLKAYHKVSELCMNSFNGVRIGLTGSAGKTTVKDWLYDTLSLYGKTFATDGNKNSIYGLPWTIIKNALKDNWNTFEFGIFEMSMTGQGEISSMCSFVKPNISLVNNIYPMHMEYFPEDGINGIAKAKSEIFKGSDVSIYNADTNCSGTLLNSIDCDFINFGKKSEIIKLISFDNNAIELKINNKPFEYSIGAGNTDMTVYNSMAVLSVIYSLGLPLDKAIDNMKNLFLGIGRGKVFKLKFNNKEITLIDHSYSGQPDSSILAISDFANINHDGRKVLIFGNMSEIGKTVEEEHIKIAELVNKTDINITYGIKSYAEIVVNKLKEFEKNAEFFDDVNKFLTLIDDKIQDNDLILIKGSHYSSSVFKIVEFLTK